MPHPTLDDLLAGDAASLAHLDRCVACRRFAALAELTQSPARPLDLGELPPVDREIYDDWSPLPGGRGGMGKVYRARDRRLGRHVAIKQIRGGSTGARAALRARFEREARLTASLQHPSIVGVHEAGRFADGEPFYAMPLLSGTPLGKEIARRTTLAERMGLLPNMAAVAEAIAFAHSHGIVHRDIKPDNILVGSFGETVVIDWGLAKQIREAGDAHAHAHAAVDGDTGDGGTRFGVGTAHYMPPEQSRGDDPDARVDVYAVGATLYHLLAGKPPYGETDHDGVRRALAEGPPRPLTEVVEDVPPELADIVARAMAREREVRYATAQELADELRRFLTGQLLRSRRYTPRELVRHYARRHRTALRVIAVALLVLAAVGVFSFVRVTRERDRARLAQQRAEVELRRARGVVASRLAADPMTRFEALALAIRAVAPDLGPGRQPTPEAFQGLLDALTMGPMLVPLEHEGVIKATAFSGTDLLGIDDSRALVLWDARSGAVRAKVALTQASPEYVALSPDGAHVVVCGFTPVVEVVDRATRAVRRFDTRTNPALCSFLPDGRLFVAADELTVHDLKTLAVVDRAPLPAPATGAAIDPDGQIAVSTLDGALHHWRPGLRLDKLADTGTTSTGLVFGERGVLLQIGADHVVRVWVPGMWPRTPGDPVMPGEGEAIFEDRRMQFARTYVSAKGELAIGMFDLDKRRATAVLDGWWKTRCELDSMAQGWIDQDWLVTERYGPILFVDTTTCQPVLTLDEHHDEAAGRVAYEVGAARLISADRGGHAFLWDLRSGRATGLLLAHSGEVVTVSPSPRRDRVLTAAHDGKIVVWRADDGARVATASFPSELLAAAWIDDDLIVTGDLAGEVHTVAPATGTITATRSLGAPISALVPAHGRVAIGSLGGDLVITDRALDHALALGAHGPVTALAWSHDGRRLASGHAGGLTALWDTTSGRELARRDADASDEDRDGHAALHFSDDDATLLAGRPDGTTRVFDARDLRDAAAAPPATARLVAGTRLPGARADAILAGHRDAVLAVARSASGARLVSGDLDGHVRVWDAATGAALAAITTPRHGAATRVAFLDDDHVVVGHQSGAVRIYPVTASAALDRACGLAGHLGRTGDLAPHCDRAHVDR